MSKSSSDSSSSSSFEEVEIKSSKKEAKGTPKKDMHKSKHDHHHHHHDHDHEHDHHHEHKEKDEMRKSKRVDEDRKSKRADDDPRKSRNHEKDEMRKSKKHDDDDHHHHHHDHEHKEEKKEKDDMRKSKRVDDDPRKSKKEEKENKEDKNEMRKSKKHDDHHHEHKEEKKEKKDKKVEEKKEEKEEKKEEQKIEEKVEKKEEKKVEEKKEQKEEKKEEQKIEEKEEKKVEKKEEKKVEEKKEEKVEKKEQKEEKKESESGSETSSSSSSSSSEEEDEKIMKRMSKVVTIPVENEEKKKNEVKLKTVSPATPFVDIPESVSIKPLETEVVAFEGMKQEDFDRLKKYNESYEDGRNLLHYFILNMGMYEGMAYYQEKAKQPKITFKKFANEVKIASRAYVELEVPKRAVMFLTKNTWTSYALGLGCVLAGMIQVYVNPNLPLADLIECVKQAGVFQVVTDMDHKELATDLIELTKIKGLLIDGVTHDEMFMTYDDFKNLGQRMDDTIIQKMMKEALPTDIAEIVFIQGVKGIHGVVWTHGNIISQMNAFKNSFAMSKEHRVIMSHHMSFYLERIFTLYLPIMFGYLTYIPSEGIHHEGLKHFIETARHVKPTIVYGVPRFYEKLLERAKEAVKESKATKRAQFLGVQGYINQESGVSKPQGFGRSRNNVFNPMKDKLGILETQYFLCTDILPRDKLEEIYGKGIELFCGLALPETTGFCFVNRERNLQLESVGRPLKGVNIVFKGKSNLLVSGAIVAGGYTDEMIGAQGFDTKLQAKVMKYRDSNIAFVKITERSHEMIHTSTGEQIAQTRIEEVLKNISVVQNVMVVGADKPFLSVIMTVKYDEAKKRLQEKCPEEKDLIRDVYFASYIRQRIDRINKMFPNPVQVKRFALILEGTEESKWIKETMNDEDRTKACEHFAKAIEALYKRGGKEIVQKDKKEEEAIQKERMKEEKERLKEEKEQRRLNKMKEGK